MPQKMMKFKKTMETIIIAKVLMALQYPLLSTRVHLNLWMILKSGKNSSVCNIKKS